MSENELARNESEEALNENEETLNENEPESIEGVLERVTESDPEAAKVISQYIEVHRSHRGPMPSPDDLKQYSLTLANLPDRMMVMAEKSQAEKSRQNEKILELKEKEIAVQRLEVEQADSSHKREISTQKLSIAAAFFIVLVCILGSLYLAIIDKTEVALVIGGTTVVGVVVAFLKNKSNDNKTSS